MKISKKKIRKQIKANQSRIAELIKQQIHHVDIMPLYFRTAELTNILNGYYSKKQKCNDPKITKEEYTLNQNKIKAAIKLFMENKFGIEVPIKQIDLIHQDTFSND